MNITMLSVKYDLILNECDISFVNTATVVCHLLQLKCSNKQIFCVLVADFWDRGLENYQKQVIVTRDLKDRDCCSQEYENNQKETFVALDTWKSRTAGGVVTKDIRIINFFLS